MKRIAIFCPYPLNEAPSQRFRFEQYLSLLAERGCKITFLPLYNQSVWKSLYQKSNILIKGYQISLSILQQIFRCFTVISYDFVMIHREILPIGPPILEWTIAKIFRKKIIYDFDDAIWLTDNKNESWLTKKLRWRSKVATLCEWSFKVSCGNEYLCNYARKFSDNVVLNPTTIDTERVHKPLLFTKNPVDINKITIGWTGSHSTLKYLEELEPVLRAIEEKYSNVTLLVIADQPPDLKLKNLQFRQWNKDTEIRDLMLIDIGIMPLPDDDWTKGKCGFKALQYMAMEIPCIVSPVGVNISIISHNENGFLAFSEKDWNEYFEKLIQDASLRKEIGRAGRDTVIKNYSVSANEDLFVSLFE